MITCVIYISIIVTCKTEIQVAIVVEYHFSFNFQREKWFELSTTGNTETTLKSGQFRALKIEKSPPGVHVFKRGTRLVKNAPN